MLLVVTVSPMILSVIFGMQWVPVVFVFVVTNAPAIYYIVSYQKVELEVCITSSTPVTKAVLVPSGARTTCRTVCAGFGRIRF